MLFINRVFPPDEGATGQLLAELARALGENGWRVTVLAANAEAGEQSRESWPCNVTVYRVRGLPFTRAAHWKRALSYLSLYPALLMRGLRLPRHDVVVTLTDPPLQFTLGPILKVAKRSRLVHWAQDVYPEVAEELGVLRRQGVIARFLRTVSTWALRRHDAVVTVGRCMTRRLAARSLASAKIHVIPNWPVGFSSPHVSPLPPHVLPFTVMYSGNFGLAHPFEAIIAAAQRLEREEPSVRFIFAGAGPRLALVRQALAPCRNVEFRPPEPLASLHASLASADVHLACMREELCGLVVPSKVYGVLAAGRPCIFIGPRESAAAELIAQSGAGVVLGVTHSGEGLAAVLKRWSARGGEYQQALAAAQVWSRQNESVPWREFVEVFETVTRGQP